MGGLFSRPCYSCGRKIRDAYLCGTCRQKTLQEVLLSGSRCVVCSDRLYRETPGLCLSCREKKPVFLKNVSLLDYHDPLAREIFHAFKFHGDLRAGQEIASWVSGRIRELFSRPHANPLAIPVPLSRDSRRQRGFNQVEYLLKTCRVPFVTALERVRHGRSQSELSARDRKRAIRGQFRVRADRLSAVRGRELAVVDDVYTTGSTAAEISQILLSAGARSVEIMTFFRD